jgi:diguanylate cyclase (GGDEF)-like protein
LEVEAMSDVLTELYNRRGWEKLLLAEEKRCQRYGHPAGVIYIDLDHLKVINDTKGHPAGDKLIYQTAQIIRSEVRGEDITARVGGDEFAVLGVECNFQQIQALAERLSASLLKAGISVSAGYASRHPSQGLMVAYEEADQRMYQLKNRKKNTSIPTDLNRN